MIYYLFMVFLRNCINKIRLSSRTAWALFKDYSSPSEPLPKKRSIFFKVILLSLVSIVFLTILMQAPMFVERKINSFVLFLWPILLIFIVIYDYRSFLCSLLKTTLIIFPFFVYLIISSICGIPSITGDLTRMIFLSAFICVLSQSLATHVSKKNIQFLLVSYIISSIFLGILIYFYSLRGSDISSQVYAYGTKNSSAPIIFLGALMTFYVKGNNKFVTYAFRIVINVFCVLLIAIMKCRTVLITFPFAYFALFLFKKPSTKIFLLTILIIAVGLILIFAVPQLRTMIIEEILFNNKGNQGIDAVFSGRISLILKALANLKPILGSGNKYVDCLPVQIICSFGVVGAITLIPYFFLPVYFLVKLKRHEGKTSYYYLYILVLVVFLFNLLLEGHGHFGPGAKSFILWMLGAFMDKNYIDNKIDIFTVNLSNHTKNNSFIICLSGLGTVLLFVIMCLNPLYQSISLSIYNRVDVATKASDYVPIDHIEIIGPDKMCVGQTVQFKANVFPENATDKQIFWESWSESLSIDSLTGIATAKSQTGLNIKAFCYDYKIGAKHGVRIVEQNNFDFSEYDFTISLGKENQTKLFIGQKIKINYDTKIFPCEKLISYSTSNDNLTIDNGYVIANKSGKCDLYATISNGYMKVSNILHITIEQTPIQTIDRIELDMDNSVYENIEYDYKPRFYSGNKIIEQCDYITSLSNVNYELNDDKIRFTSNGLSAISIKPINSIYDDLVYVKELEIKRNLPTDLSIKSPDWMIYGEKYEFQVYINFENGQSRLAKESEIKPKSLRAGVQRSGVCDDSFHYASIKSGSASITYDLKGTNIYKKQNLQIYTVDKDVFYKNARNFVFPLTSLLYFLLVSFTCLFVFRTKLHQIIFDCVIFFVYLMPYILSIILNTISVSPLFYILITLFIFASVVINCFLMKYKFTGLYENLLVLNKRKTSIFFEVSI